MKLTLDNFVVMPNHIHGIIHIGDNEYNNGKTKYIRKDHHHKVTDRFAPQSNNLGAIIRGYKSAVTIQSRKLNPDFAWLPRYSDVLIKDHKQLVNMNNYIYNNPINYETKQS